MGATEQTTRPLAQGQSWRRTAVSSEPCPTQASTCRLPHCWPECRPQGQACAGQGSATPACSPALAPHWAQTGVVVSPPTLLGSLSSHPVLPCYSSWCLLLRRPGFQGCFCFSVMLQDKIKANMPLMAELRAGAAAVAAWSTEEQTALLAERLLQASTQ